MRVMLTTPHAVVGAAIGALVVNPLLVIPAAIASHFLLDSVPHWQETLAPYEPSKKTWIRIPIDLALAVSLVGLLAYWVPDRAGAVWLGAVMGNLPDLDVIMIVMPQLKRGLLRKYWDWHCRIQRETGSLWGVVPQVAVIMMALPSVYWGR